MQASSASRVAIPLLLLAALIAGIPGCQTTNRSEQTDEQIMAQVRERNQRRIDAMQRRYLIGPIEAEKLGYRVDWQSQIASSRVYGVKHLSVQGDSVFVLDDRNFLVRFRRDDGNRMWRISVGKPNLEIQGIAYAPAYNRVYLTAGGDLLVHDAGTGGQVARVKLEKLAATAPQAVGDFLIYGSRNGQLVWFNHPLAFDWKSYQIAHSINTPPVIAGGRLVTVGSNGELMVLTAADARMLWSWPVLGQIVSQPAIGQGVVYVPSTNQTLYAFDLGSGRKLWEALTSSRLTDSPTAIDDRVYQQVAAEGIVCFDALPPNSRLGVEIWTAEGVRGNVAALRAGQLLVWDKDDRIMTLLEPGSGRVIEHVRLPGASSLVVAGAKDGEIFAAGLDGRLIRLVPEG